MVDFEMIEKIEEWGFDLRKEYWKFFDDKIEVKYKLYHEYAIMLILLGDYLADEFEEYLKDNEIELGNWDNSDVEEFFEQYGIEVY